MNPGAFSGTGDASFGQRKVIGLSGLPQSGAADASTGTLVDVAEVVGTSIPAGTRSLIFSAKGKGAALFFSGYQTGAGTGLSTFELEVDGRVIATVKQNAATSGSRTLVGSTQVVSGAKAGYCPGYLPFSQSLKVYFTPGSAAQTPRWYYLIESHQ